MENKFTKLENLNIKKEKSRENYEFSKVEERANFERQVMGVSSGTNLAAAIICNPPTTKAPKQERGHLTDAQKVYVGVFIPSLFLVIVLVGAILFVVFRNKISFKKARFYSQSKEDEVDSVELPS